MRKITSYQVSVFMAMMAVILSVTIMLTLMIRKWLPPNEIRALVCAIVALFLFYIVAFLVYRSFLLFIPLREGEIKQGSQAEFAAQVNILFYLLIFNSLIRTNFIPVPILKIIYLLLGAKMGKNTYSAGALLDPPLTVLGSNCIVGHNAVIFAHAIEGAHMALNRVVIGDGVTIGAMAVVMSNVKIGDRAIISAGSVVLKGTTIGSDEVWGGVPARKLR